MERPGHGTNLLDTLITEVLADHFDLEVFGGESQLWCRALSDKESKVIMKKAEHEFHNKIYDHSS